MHRDVHLLRGPEQVRHSRLLLADVFFIDNSVANSHSLCTVRSVDYRQGMFTFCVDPTSKYPNTDEIGHTHLYAMHTNSQVLGRRRAGHMSTDTDDVALRRRNTALHHRARHPSLSTVRDLEAALAMEAQARSRSHVYSWYCRMRLSAHDNRPHSGA
jgi:hypothetical protein